jgi:hypothetical protein
VLLFNSYIFFGPISAKIAFFLSSISAANFLGSFGFAAGGGFPPFFLVSSISFSSYYAFFLSSF